MVVTKRFAVIEHTVETKSSFVVTVSYILVSGSCIHGIFCQTGDFVTCIPCGFIDRITIVDCLIKPGIEVKAYIGMKGKTFQYSAKIEIYPVVECKVTLNIFPVTTGKCTGNRVCQLCLCSTEHV